uniref:Coiled-coil SMC6 And NSE5 INteracting (CANIN) domain-containing protein n=1 Tax=Oryza glumipatula TaxID=40148 RepID=A0A0D9Y5X3_9ORYZ
MLLDEPLDFEKEDPLLPKARPAKRKKVIELDDLLEDFFASGKDDLKAYGIESKHGSKGYNSDDEDKKVKEKEIKFRKFVEEYEEQSKELDAGDDVPQWGQRVFGCQKSPSVLSVTGVENCQLLKSFCANEHLGFDLNIEQGEGFLEGLLVDGWLLKLVLLHGSVEDSIASWALTKLLYSCNKKFRVAASDFWDSVLSLNEADKLSVDIGHFPSYSVLKSAILNYGYIFDNCTEVSTSESVIADDGPPQNIIEWLKITSACCKIRNVHSIFSSSEAEELLVIVISLFLDRQLEGLLLILGDCLSSLILYFNSSEWESSCLIVAQSISQRVTMDLNCLRIVDCITGTDYHSKFLRSQLALQFLKVSFGLKVANVEKILKSVMSINVKDKDCNFFSLYVYLVLMDNLLFSSDAFRDKHAIINSWRNYLRNCSTQIGCTDWRLYASKVRNKASYLLQGAVLRRSAGGASLPVQ